MVAKGVFIKGQNSFVKLLLTLNSGREKQLMPINYQYPFSAVIYRILANADERYASFLHDTGYRQSDSLKSFKLFTFSDLKAPFKIQGDRLQLLTREAMITVSFHLPEAAEHFIKGLFMNQQIEIADKVSRAVFNVARVETLSNSLTQKTNQEVILQPVSPIVCGRKDEKRNYTFLSPEDERYEEMLFLNWQEKLKAFLGTDELDELMADAFIQIVFFKNPPKSRLITIKAGTPAETKIRGFNNFTIKIKGKKEAVELLLNSGVGLYNAQGMGCVEVIEP